MCSGWSSDSIDMLWQPLSKALTIPARSTSGIAEAVRFLRRADMVVIGADSDGAEWLTLSYPN